MNKTVTENRKAKFLYAIEETLEAGLVLQGWEVKSLRTGGGDMTGAYIDVRKGEGFLIGSTVTALKQSKGNPEKCHETRIRKLLLKGRELRRLSGKTQEQKYAIVPLKLYFNHKGILKLLIGVGKRKHYADRRQEIKKRQWNRQKQALTKKIKQTVSR